MRWVLAPHGTVLIPYFRPSALRVNSAWRSVHARERTHLSDLIADFIAYFGGDPRGRGTTHAYADDLRQFLALVGLHGVRQLGQVDRSVVYGYLAELRGKGYQPETIHRRLAALQSFFRYLMTARVGNQSNASSPSASTPRSGPEGLRVERGSSHAR